MRSFPWLLVVCLAGACATKAANPVFNGQGELAGEVTATSAILQSRLTATSALTDGDVAGAAGVARFEIARSADWSGSRTTEWLRATPEHDFIVKAVVDRLEPGTRYHYRLIYGSDQRDVQTGPARSFKTLAGPGAAAETTFIAVTGMNYNGFYRGARAYKGADRALGYPALKAILDARPDFFIGTGDNVYYDLPVRGRAQTQPEMRRKWHEQFVQPRMIDLLGQVASYWQKDDHDYRVNDADNTGDYLPSVDLGKATFLEQMPVVDPRASGAVTYRTYRVSKDLQIWLTEGRDYRSPNRSEAVDKTLWGAEQLQWLKQTLTASDATFKILISPTPMIGPDDVKIPMEPYPGQDGIKRDNHGDPAGFRRERDAFVRWLGESRLLDQFYIVCGDRHWQYHSIDPAGLEEFSAGAIIDENSRMGRAPGDPESDDPNGLVKQPYTSREPSGGFLKVIVRPGATPTADFRFLDEHGVELYAVRKEALGHARER